MKHEDLPYSNYQLFQDEVFPHGPSPSWNDPITNLLPECRPREHYYKLQKSNACKPKFSCSPCNQNFFSYEKYNNHIQDHVQCPFPECKLIACLKVIDQHISHQHILVNFEALQVDDEKWIADRKARFPTLQRAELRRVQQTERLKRGERLNKERVKGIKNRSNFKRRKTFPDFQYKKTNWENNNSETSSRDRKKQIIQNLSNVDLYDSDDETKKEVLPFKGMAVLKESIGEFPLFGININEEMTGGDISDEDDEIDAYDHAKTKESENFLNNALGALMAINYGSDSGSEVDISKKNESTTVNNTESKAIITNAASSDNSLQMSHVKRIRKRKFHQRNCSNISNAQNMKQKSKINRPAFKKRRPTLLERLLQNDIHHERNVILQCIRYIVNNNYFDIRNQ